MSGDKRLAFVGDDPAFDWLKLPQVQALFKLLNRDGEEVRIVGGAVRNSLLGMVVKDFDCAATAEPSLVMHWAHDADVRVLPTGLDHGTVTLLIDDMAFEVTTLRTDVETDGRHAQVAFGRDWSVDAHRRDFTMNAVYLDKDGCLHDPTGCGIEDARLRVVRFIGNADRRIAEDYLRILRFFRFYAQYGENFRREDYRACIAAQKSLSTLSAERVGVEMVKLVQGPFAMAALHAMHVGGMLGDVLGSVPRLSRFSGLLRLASSLRLKPDLSLLLTALCVEVEEDAQRVAKTLRLPNRIRDIMVRLVRGYRSVNDPSEAAIQTLAYLHGKEVATSMIMLAIVDRRLDPDLTELSMELHGLELWSVPDFPISGRDLLDHGMAPGPEVGSCLSRLEARWVKSGFALTRSELLSAKLMKCL
ncbi:CCA tRNA nucleotidyltransferase [uncultured Cohaesibacter sp.]|uniref:CCA tRNA nucleotidyltransferase n=1 Tax=uncultured Cohaesibacter sp. TaxID=1002546 RepID=UPI0029C9AE50|nr:CCA tRNA nucleotidyltransferase [uncultured Cohaesibacter sp.]